MTKPKKPKVPQIPEATAGQTDGQVTSEPISMAEKIISGGVVLGGLLIAILLIGILHLNLKELTSDFTSTATGCLDNAKGQALGYGLTQFQACQIALEAEAQVLRTSRAQFIVAARLFTNSIAILAGISLLTMGSSFVFARIKGPASNLEAEIKMASEGNWKVLFNSYFPGVILALFGTFIVVSTVYFAKDQKSKTNDRPVFLDWPKGSYSEIYPSFFATGDLTEEEEEAKASGIKKLIDLGVVEEED